MSMRAILAAIILAVASPAFAAREWVQWLGGDGQPTGPSISSRRVEVSVDTANNVLYWMEYVDSNTGITLYVFSGDESTGDLDSYAISAGADSNERLSDLGYDAANDDLVITGSWRILAQDRAQALYANSPITSTPSFTTVQGSGQARAHGMFAYTPSGGAGKEFYSVSIAPTTRSVSRDGVTNVNYTPTGEISDGLSFACAHPSTGTTAVFGFGSTTQAIEVSATGSISGFVSDAPSVNGPGSASDMLGCEPLGESVVASGYRESGGVFHPYAYDLSTNTLTEGTRLPSYDIRLGFSFDGKVWGVEAGTRDMMSTSDGLTWSADTGIDDYPGADNPAKGFILFTGDPAILGDDGEMWVWQEEGGAASGVPQHGPMCSVNLGCPESGGWK